MPEMAESSTEGRSELEVGEGGVLTNMDVFTIDLRRGMYNNIMSLQGAAVTYF